MNLGNYDDFILETLELQEIAVDKWIWRSIPPHLTSTADRIEWDHDAANIAYNYEAFGTEEYLLPLELWKG